MCEICSINSFDSEISSRLSGLTVYLSIEDDAKDL